MLEVQLIGRLGKDPEARYTPEGVLVTNFPVAVNGRKDETIWLEVAAWRELGERCHQYLTKGRQVFVRGYLTVDTYMRKNGEPGASLKVTASVVQFLGGKKSEAEAAVEEDDDLPF